MSSPIKFGTDGWRAIIAEDFTFANVRACAQGIAHYLQDVGFAPRGLVIGYDTRFASEHFAAAAAEVVAGNGIKVYLCQKPTPTPVVSYSLLHRKAAGAIIITSSHNPALWNGLKYKPEYAGSASPEVIAELEKRIAQAQASGQMPRKPLEEARSQGLIEDIDASQPYLEHLAQLVDLERLRRAHLRIVVDSMYGAAAGYFQGLLSGGNNEIIELHQERNPLFPGLNPEPIEANLRELEKAVREHRALVGLATDGDGDRLGVVSEQGGFISTLQVFALLAYYFLEVRGERGPIVKSLSTSQMIYRLGALYGVPVYETAVGFKYIGPKMMAENALLGGEESGGFGYRGHMPERDGILSGLYFLDLLVQEGKTPSQLLERLYEKVGPHYFNRIDLPFPPEQRDAILKRLSQAQPPALGGSPVTSKDTLDGFRFKLSDGSWLLIRFSGTEPIMRIYAESSSSERVAAFLAIGRELAGV